MCPQKTKFVTNTCPLHFRLLAFSQQIRYTVRRPSGSINYCYKNSKEDALALSPQLSLRGPEDAVQKGSWTDNCVAKISNDKVTAMTTVIEIQHSRENHKATCKDPRDCSSWQFDCKQSDAEHESGRNHGSNSDCIRRPSEFKNNCFSWEVEIAPILCVRGSPFTHESITVPARKWDCRRFRLLRAAELPVSPVVSYLFCLVLRSRTVSWTPAITRLDGLPTQDPGYDP